MPLLLVGAGITVRLPHRGDQHRRRGPDNRRGHPRHVAGPGGSRCFPRILLVPLTFLFGAIGGRHLGRDGRGPQVLRRGQRDTEHHHAQHYRRPDPQPPAERTSHGSRRDRAGIAHSPYGAAERQTPTYRSCRAGTRLHFGVVIAVLMAIACYVLLFRTTQGLRLRASGHNPFRLSLRRDVGEAQRGAGLRVQRGPCAVWPGSRWCSEVKGIAWPPTAAPPRSPGAAGFNGIVAALFGGLHPLWTIPASFLFGSLLVGANAMQRGGPGPSGPHPGPERAGGGVRGRQHAGPGPVGEGPRPRLRAEERELDRGSEAAGSDRAQEEPP